MKLPYQLALIIIGLVLFIALALTLSDRHFEWLSFISYYGLVGCATGLLSLLAAFIISIAYKEKRSYTQGILLGGGIVLLTGAFAIAYAASHIEFGR